MKTSHQHRKAAALLETLDLGSSIAEQDTLLQSARVETSAFSDLLQDKVGLIPGTKGSGKSALFRMFVDFLPENGSVSQNSAQVPVLSSCAFR
jgi:ABC-type cobalamin/Fe3+-siderophores transport system ATPase subunit